MRYRCIQWLAVVAGLSVMGVRSAGAQEPAQPENTQAAASADTVALRKPEKAIETGLSFLVNDVAKWRADRGCATCHHGTMSVWALSEAKAQGYAVDEERYAQIVQWTKDRMATDMHAVRDPRPGWNLVSVPLIYLSAMSQNLPVLSRDQVKGVALHLARHQEQDGSFLMPLPAIHGPPPTWESSETLVLWALLAWEPCELPDPMETAEVRAARERTLAWLGSAEPSRTTQSTALRLLLDVRTGQPAEQLQGGISELLALQNADGGWSQQKDLASDAYATGQALYVLSFAGLKNDRPEVQRAIEYLAATQKDDGSWAVTSRNHPGVESTKSPVRWEVPITYFGSSWAILGLVRVVPTPPDSAPKQQSAFDNILAFHGKYEVDESVTERPVVGVDLRYYEVSDQEVGKLTGLLQAFPRLTSLQFKSTKITDGGLGHLKQLPQLRTLVIENAMITDAGLAPLKELVYLETLNLKGTQVTDAGVEDLKRSLSKLSVER